MRIYVAGPLADVEGVRRVQAEVVAAGHELTLDWSRGPDSQLSDYDSAPEASARIARDDLDAVLTADAVIVVASEHPGRGMFVELGAALASATGGGRVRHVVVAGPIRHESVFYFHPAVTRVAHVGEWLATVA
ncbi:hypothetical protein ASG73_02115 [Janibacter sp. Soil728]|uniref:nucleoside 2-deoxyribosyltransferase n=1 Tax=Janibacter sp. Soil728 TaxID=1736393 RepID=UPI000712BAC7|nr:nucleoside 2-deoxyribosyltransferase [Janibacter sp. Soil728]KRE39164.1 hypothetical protein ASG73_02115 [Janibacter sp. Soil728]